MSSLLSFDSFMGSGGIIGLDEEKRDMSEVLAEVLLTTTNFVGLIGTEVAKQIKHEHLEDELVPTVIAGAWTYSSTTFDPDATTQAEVNRLFRSNGSTGCLGAVLSSKDGAVSFRRTVDSAPLIAGDTNWDGVVDIWDLKQVMEHWLSAGSGP